MAVWYGGYSKWNAVTPWSAAEAVTVGTLRRATAPAVDAERVFMCIVAGTTGGTEPTWVTTKGAKTAADGTVTWQEITGRAAVNGDMTNTDAWAPNASRALGDIVKNIAGTHLFVVSTTTGGTPQSAGSEPSWNTTPGATTTDNGSGTVTWTCIGATGSFGAYAAPFARVNLCLTGTLWPAITDVAYFSQAHNQTQSGSAINYSNTSGCQVICVDDAVVPPTTEAFTGVIETTGNNAITITAGFLQGFIINAGSGAVSAGMNIGSSGGCRLRKCQLNVKGTSGGVLTTSGGTGGETQLEDCDITFASTASNIALAGYSTTIRGGSICATGSVPASGLFSIGGAKGEVIGVDLSNVTTLAVSASNPAGMVDVIGCKLHPSVAYMTQPSAVARSSTLRVHNSGSDTVTYNNRQVNGAALTAVDTSVVRTGGATDGATPVALAITTNTGCRPGYQYRSEPIVKWNASVGSLKTAKVELTTDATLTKGDAWLEVMHLGDASSPKLSLASTRVNLSPAELDASSATWGGSAKSKKYKIEATFTPQLAGPVRARVCIAKAGVTVYIDPQISIT